MTNSPTPTREPDPIALAWGEELRHRRTTAAEPQTQVQLAQVLGVHQTTVSQIERGLLVPSPTLQRALIDIFDLDDATVVRLVRGEPREVPA